MGSFEVVVTARSYEKGQRIVESIDKIHGKRVSYVVVEDIAKEGAFDEVRSPRSSSKILQPNTFQAVESDPPFDYVIHTASPYQLHWDDPVKDCLEPAIYGTTGILASIKAHAPSVKRVVITSSSAAILSPPNHRAVYDESCWSDVSWEQAKDVKHTYRASKVGRPSFITAPEIFPREPLRRFGTLHINTHPPLSLGRNSPSKPHGPSSRPKSPTSLWRSSTTRTHSGRFRAALARSVPSTRPTTGSATLRWAGCGQASPRRRPCSRLSTSGTWRWRTSVR